MFKNGRFFTGDIGWIDDKGRLHIKGRKSDVLVMSDGDKLFCPECEDDLERMTGLPDLGIVLKNGDAVLVAGSCPKDPNISEEIRRKLTSEVGIYNRLIPHSRQISGVIVTSDALPRSVTGKLKRNELKKIYAGGE